MGLAIARRFARDGYAIGLIARRREPLQAAAATMAGAPRVEVEAADLSDPIAAAGAVRTLAGRLGAPDVLVDNAATWNAVPAMAMTPEQFRADLDLCVTGALACAQAAYPAMRARGSGSLLFTGGGLALRPEFGAGVAGLTAGKSALRGLVFALAGELAPEGIHVGTVTIAGQVAPGTSFDPENIAEAFAALHVEPRGGWSIERIFA
jgi:NAD(P)-dependent dehydrogenase (short-subunit alcohol dehydrogenase family)